MSLLSNRMRKTRYQRNVLRQKAEAASSAQACALPRMHFVPSQLVERQQPPIPATAEAASSAQACALPRMHFVPSQLVERQQPPISATAEACCSTPPIFLCDTAHQEIPHSPKPTNQQKISAAAEVVARPTVVQGLKFCSPPCGSTKKGEDRGGLIDDRTFCPRR